MKQAALAFGQPADNAFAGSSDFRVLTDEELLMVSGAVGGGNVAGAVMGGLQGAVVGGIAGAAGAAATGQPIGAGGISGMVSGGIAGAWGGFSGGGAA